MTRQASSENGEDFAHVQSLDLGCSACALLQVQLLINLGLYIAERAPHAPPQYGSQS